MSGMSQTARPQYTRSFGGLVIAMVVAVVVAVVWYWLGRPDESTRPIPTVDAAEWGTWVKSGRADGKLALFAPTSLPKGWRATSASYQTGVSPHWHLGLLTASGKYVGLEESPDSTQDLVGQYVDDNAVRGKDVTIGAQTWQTYTDPGGDYAVVRSLTAPGGGQERILVVGSAAPAQIRDYAASLKR
jgi:hypothetical protein